MAPDKDDVLHQLVDADDLRLAIEQLGKVEGQRAALLEIIALADDFLDTKFEEEARQFRVIARRCLWNAGSAMPADRLEASAGRGDVVLHVAGNGRALTVDHVAEVVKRIEADPAEAAIDAVRLVRFLASALSAALAAAPSAPDAEGGGRCRDGGPYCAACSVPITELAQQPGCGGEVE